MNLKKQSVFLLTVCALFFAVSCSEQTEPQAKTEMPSESAPESTPESVPPSLEDLLTNPGRASTDQARDAGRKPAAVMAFLGVNPGMTVVDLLAAGGYYTEVLSLAVGSHGKVYAHNTAGMLSFRDGANDKAMTARLADNRLTNVERWDREFSDFGLEAGSVDVAITALNFHDIYNNGGTGAAQGVLAVVKTILKPGGILGIIDHVGDADGDNKKLHRIDPDIVRAEVSKAGFEIDEESGVLANPEDNHDGSVFGELRGKTDRFVIRLRKAEE